MSEEQKAIKILEEMKNNYSLNGEDLHYANILYYLIINLQQQNKQLKEKIEELENINDKISNALNSAEKKIDRTIEFINEFPSLRYSSVDTTNGKRLSGKLVPIDDLLKILKELEEGNSNDR